MEIEPIDRFAAHDSLMGFLKHSSTLATAIAVLSTALLPSNPSDASIVFVWMSARMFSVWGLLIAFGGYFFGTIFRDACKDGAFGSGPFKMVMNLTAFASGVLVLLSAYTLAANKDWRTETPVAQESTQPGSDESDY